MDDWLQSLPDAQLVVLARLSAKLSLVTQWLVASTGLLLPLAVVVSTRVGPIPVRVAPFLLLPLALSAMLAVGIVALGRNGEWAPKIARELEARGRGESARALLRDWEEQAPHVQVGQRILRLTLATLVFASLGLSFYALRVPDGSSLWWLVAIAGGAAVAAVVSLLGSVKSYWTRGRG
jgi:hypothetical protein